MVFRALNTAEAVLAVVALAACGIWGHSASVVPAVVAAVLLAAQLALVRPGLNRRSDRVLAGEELPRSRAHLYYVALECLKVLALLALGISVLTAGA